MESNLMEPVGNAIVEPHMSLNVEANDDEAVPLSSQSPLDDHGGYLPDEQNPLISYEDDFHRYKPRNCCERYCCGGLQGMACGWPKGTVRAMIAVIMIVIVLLVQAFLVVWLAVKGSDTTSAIAVAGALLAELGGVLGFYYGTRSSSGSSDDTTHHDEREETAARPRRVRR